MDLNVTTNTKKISSSFLKNYQIEVVEWADYVNSNSKNILAISRKGPRLIELLHKVGLIKSRVFHNTFSEYALPFLGEMDDLSIIDDSVLYGSTLNKMLHLSEQYLNIEEKNVDIVPIKYSTDTPNEVQNKINRNISALIDTHKTTHYIGSLITSFKYLGKPYDIEHPIVYFQGDFSDIEFLKIKIDNINNLISEHPLIINDNDNSYPPSFTILLNGGENPNNDDFSKFRIYLNADLTKLAIVPISPVVISNDDIENLGTIINPVFADIWEKVYGSVNKIDEPESLDKRSLVVFANYLNSFSLLLNHISQFDKYFNQSEMFFDTYDLQILLGTKIANTVTSELNNIIVNKFENKHIKSISNFVEGTVENFVFPFGDYELKYNEFLKNRIDSLKALDEEFEIINMIFVAQHYQIEIPSRKDNHYDSSNRLTFGVSLQYIIDKVKEIKPNCSIIKIHLALDKLIDCGTIVPKYRNVSNQKKQVIWRRVFRVGEGSPSTIQRILTVEHLLRGFPDDYLQNGIPEVVLEKSLVIALTNTFHFDVLQEECINSLGVAKKFDLDGARSYFKNSDGSGHYLLDWLEFQNVIIQQPNDSYKVNDTIFDNHEYWSDAKKELSITSSAKDKLEDIANFCYTVSNQINENALVSITSLSTEREYWQAISAELSLWLNHPKYNIYNCIHKLDEISLNTPSNALLNLCNSLLEKNANFTAQIFTKKSLFEKFDNDMIEIEKVAEGTNNTSIKRVWRDIRDSIYKRRGQSRASFNDDVLSVLRISHITTSICRTLLNKAGFSGTRAHKSIKSYLESLLQAITNSPDLIKNHFQDKDVLDELRNVIINYDETDDFFNTYQKLRKSLGNIVIVCDNLYEEIATEPKEYYSKSLNPPVYVVMWDMRNSTSVDNRNDIEQNVIFPVNEKIKKMLKNSRRNPFQVFEEYSDDGNCFLTNNFNHVISAFLIISGIAEENNVTFRMGCDVNYEGELHVYTSLKKNLFAGRAFEYAARTTSLYKEIGNTDLWLGNQFNYVEPSKSYLLVSEFAKRKACSDSQWNFSDIQVLDFDGEYLPRVKPGTSIPYKVFQLTYRLSDNS